MNPTIIIPTLNAESTLAELINALRRQSLLGEIIVIDSSSIDKTLEIAVDKGCRTHRIRRNEFDHGGTRNMALQLTASDVLVFLTQDAIPLNDQFLQNLIEPISDPAIAASFGRQVAKTNAIPPERFARLFNYPKSTVVKSKECIPEMGIKTFFFSNVCSAFRRDAFERVGGFPSRTIMNEDMIIAANLILSNYKIAYCGEAVVWHSHNYSLGEQFRRNFDVGASMVQSGLVLDYAKSEVEGARFAKELFQYLIKNRELKWIPYSFIQLICRYVGYRLGIAERYIPIGFKRRLSMNNGFWISNDRNNNAEP